MRINEISITSSDRINNYKSLRLPTRKVVPAPNAKNIKNDQKAPAGDKFPYSPKQKSPPSSGHNQPNINRGRLVGETDQDPTNSYQDEKKIKRSFDLCKQAAANMFTKLTNEKKNPTLLQVAGYKGFTEHADPRWKKLHHDYWIHYVVVADNVVYDPTVKQFNPNGTTTYPLAELKGMWKSIHTIMGPEIK